MVTKYYGLVAAVILSASVFTVPVHADESLSLTQAVEYALKHNPTIAAGQLSADAAKSAARGARALTNPEIEVAPTIAGEAGSDSVLLFYQPLEVNGSRRVRGNIAASEAEAISYEADALRREVIREVKQAYWELVSAQELAKLYQTNVNYLSTIRESVQKQLDVGAVPGLQLVKAEVELARAKQELTQAQLDLSQAQAALNALLNRPQSCDVVATDSLTFAEVPTTCDALTNLSQERPEILAAQAELNAAEARIKAAKLQRMPDVAVQARRSSFDSDSESGIAVVVSAPLFDWGSVKADKAQAQKEAEAREKKLEAVKNAVNLYMAHAMQQVEASSSVVQQYQNGILEQTEELAAAARKGYEKGAMSYLEVLEAQRTLRSVRAEYITALASHAKAIAQLEWASGCWIDETNNLEVEE